jgi:antitoxin (DNA-binding transcriptional repressor) of toxin-antitoxin stability system
VAAPGCGYASGTKRRIRQQATGIGFINESGGPGGADGAAREDDLARRPAAGGVTVLITDRDRVGAEIVPPRSGRIPPRADARLAEAVREGWLAPPLLVGSDPPPCKPVMTLRDLMQDLQRDREDR